MPLNLDEILARFGGTAINDLNNVLNVSEDANPDDDISTLSLTHYIATHELAHYSKSHRYEFTISSLNVQSIRVKFDQLSVVLSTLYNEGLSFSLICLQETWLSENDDTAQFLLPGYSLVHQGKSCSEHGRLLTYIRNDFSYKYQLSTTMHHLGKVYLSMFLVSNCINKFMLVLSTVLLKITIIIKV